MCAGGGASISIYDIHCESNSSGYIHLTIVSYAYQVLHFPFRNSERQFSEGIRNITRPNVCLCVCVCVCPIPTLLLLCTRFTSRENHQILSQCFAGEVEGTGAETGNPKSV